MRTANLARIAVEAEILRFQHMLKRQGVRTAFGLIAAVFAVGVLVLLHVVAWQVLRRLIDPIYATCCLLGVDILITAGFAVLAARSSPSHAERDALAVRQQALHEAQSSLALTALVPIAGSLLRSRRRDAQKRPLLARWMR